MPFAYAFHIWLTPPPKQVKMLEKINNSSGELRKTLIAEWKAQASLPPGSPGYYKSEFPQFVIGAIVGATSCRKVGNKHTLVCMITPDIEIDYPECVKELNQHFDEVVVVDYVLKLPTKKLTEKQELNYGKSFAYGSTRLNCLLLEEYEKVLLIDADTVFVANTDHVFDLPTPGGIWGYFMMERKDPRTKKIIGYNSVTQSADKIPYGAHVPEEVVDILLNSSFIESEACLLLKPNGDDFDEISAMQLDFPKCPSSHEAQALAVYYKDEWTQLTNAFAYCTWKKYPVEIKKPLIIHFYSSKPWENEKSEFDDYKYWYEIFDELVTKYPKYKRYLGVLEGNERRGGEWR